MAAVIATGGGGKVKVGGCGATATIGGGCDTKAGGGGIKTGGGGNAGDPPKGGGGISGGRGADRALFLAIASSTRARTAPEGSGICNSGGGEAAWSGVLPISIGVNDEFMATPSSQFAWFKSSSVVFEPKTDDILVVLL